MATKNHEAVVGRWDGLTIDVRKLDVDPAYNVRDLDSPSARPSLDVLKESIREKGKVVTPLRVRMAGERMLVVEGHRRRKSLLELLSEGADVSPNVPALIADRYEDEAERDLGLILSNSGEPLTEPEKAKVVHRLLNHGWERKQICNRLGYKTEATIANFELWLSAPTEVKQAVLAGDIAYSTAVEIARQADGDDDKAKATLATARTTAARKGKGRVTTADVTAPRQRNAPSPQEALRKAIDALITCQIGPLSPRELAQAWGKLRTPMSAIGELSDWLYEFYEALKDVNSEMPAVSEVASISVGDEAAVH
jgi:ParB-like chromosome segregation protein Spo0J